MWIRHRWKLRKRALETAQLNLEYCYIHSPIDGRAGARLVDVGNVVQANSTSLLSIQRLDPIYANFTVTESDLPEVQKQMSMGLLKALVRLPSDAGRRSEKRQASNSSTTPCRMAVARSTCAPR